MVAVVFPDPSAVAVFAIAAAALLVVPGPAVLYIVAQSVGHGRAAGLASVAGVHLGTLVHVAAAAAGVSAVIAASATAFTTVKLAGAGYLVYLGLRRLLSQDPSEDEARGREALRTAFARGAIVNVLNPKTALFFLAFLPQFVDADRGGVWSQVVVLGLVFVLLGLVSDSLYAIAAGAVGAALRRRREAVRYASGTILIGLGATAAFAKRG